MSRSKPSTTNSPATRFFEWSAKTGELHYYDKEVKENVAVKLPFSFLILDEVSQVGGGTKVGGKYEGYWSNAVKDLNTQIITVKSKQGIVAQGLYADLKNRKGLHYVKGLYIAFYDEDKTLQIGYLKIKGSALGAWFDFTKSHRDLYQGAFAIKGKSDPIDGENGDYYTPVFVHKADVSEESDEAAKALDAIVQEYLAAYFAHNVTTDDEYTGEPNAAAVVGGRNDPQAPGGFNPSEDVEDELDSIPF
jgi:hypothetical protein